jgi:hypothetical protein
LILPALTLALAAAATAPAAHAAADLELAVQDDAVLLTRSYGDSQLALDRTVQMGARRVRVNVRWAASMPAAQARAKRRPKTIVWNFGPLLRLLDDAGARGLRLQVTLTGAAPAWATASHKVGVNQPSARYYANFVTEAVRAAAGRVDRWSIWNEPNWFSQLGPRSRAAGVYRALYRKGYAAIKREQPGAQVLIGELMPGASSSRSTPALRFLRDVTCSRAGWRAAKRCTGLVADGFALHPYNFARAPGKARNPNPDIVEMGSLSRLEKALDRLSARGALRTPRRKPMPLYLTEFGFHTAGPLAVSASRQARWLTEAWRIAKRDRRVKQLLQYLLIDPWPKGVSWRSAVLTRDGRTTPAFEALRKLASTG